MFLMMVCYDNINMIAILNIAHHLGIFLKHYISYTGYFHQLL